METVLSSLDSGCERMKPDLFDFSCEDKDTYYALLRETAVIDATELEESLVPEFVQLTVIYSLFYN